MTTSSENVTVLGVMLDPMLTCGEIVEHGQTVHQTVASLWGTLANQVDKDFTSETTDLPSATQVFLASNLSDASQSTFPALTTATPVETYLVMFGMPKSWSYVGEVSKRNKENVVTNMANLSLNDDEEHGTVASGLNKRNVPSKQQGIGQRRNVKPTPTSIASHDSRNAIELLRQEFLGRIDKQADDIKALKSSNAELKSSNTNLKSRMDDKDNEIEGLNAKIDGLEEWAKTLSRELQNEKSGRQDDMNALREVTLLLAPLHLRVLLDRTRQKILREFQCKSWEDLRCDRTVHQLVDIIDERLAHVPHHPSRDSIKFMCSYNNVRREGNVAAHSASQDEIREAVTKKPLATQERRYLEQIFEYLFDERV